MPLSNNTWTSKKISHFYYTSSSTNFDSSPANLLYSVSLNTTLNLSMCSRVQEISLWRLFLIHSCIITYRRDLRSACVLHFISTVHLFVRASMQLSVWSVTFYACVQVLNTCVLDFSACRHLLVACVHSVSACWQVVVRTLHFFSACCHLLVNRVQAFSACW